ncbi:unnamed protein product, partial [Prorocentrum cordatum]
SAAFWWAAGLGAAPRGVGGGGPAGAWRRAAAPARPVAAMPPPRRGLQCFVPLAVVGAVRLQVMVTSRWESAWRRHTQRRAIRGCLPPAGSGHEVELLFFMGDLNGTDEHLARREQEEFGDLVLVGGPDSDPPVPRDATYVLDRPAARAYRVAHGSRWLAEHRP